MNYTNETRYSEYDADFYRNIFIVAYTITAIYVVLGIFLNVWLLSAIITSTDLRMRMRNKLIISSSILHLTECCIKIPIFYAGRNVIFTDCHLHSAFVNITLMQDFISNWILVEMIVLYLCQIMDLKISESLSILGQRIVTIAVLLLPWMASLITVPAMVSSDHWSEYGCFIPKSLEIFKSIDSVVPLLLSTILLTVAIVKKWNRYRKGFSASNMQVELISRGLKLDETSPYVVGVAVSILCDVGIILLVFETIKYHFMLYYLAYLIENSRVVFMMLPWLLLKDIRTRIKTWRPWHRPLPGIDLTLTYGKGQEDQTNN